MPAETGLAKVDFPRRRERRPEPYVTPDEADSCWKKPGPAAGPFEAKLGDGSVVTYYWYRFADQPALLNADLTAAERESLQKRVEMLHRNWTKDREYLPPRRSASWPTSTRRSRRSAEGPGGRLRADRHPTGREGVGDRAGDFTKFGAACAFGRGFGVTVLLETNRFTIPGTRVRFHPRSRVPDRFRCPITVPRTLDSEHGIERGRRGTGAFTKATLVLERNAQRDCRSR